MTLPNDPVFKVGDPVKSFRDRSAVVESYLVIDDPSKSNRVTVEWSDGLNNPDKTEYYASVFEKLQ